MSSHQRSDHCLDGARALLVEAHKTRKKRDVGQASRQFRQALENEGWLVSATEHRFRRANDLILRWLGWQKWHARIAHFSQASLRESVDSRERNLPSSSYIGTCSPACSSSQMSHLLHLNLAPDTSGKIARD